MGKGKRKAFGESPAEILLKRKLGTAEYNKRKEEVTYGKIPKRPVTPIEELPNPWGRGQLIWKHGEGGMWTIETPTFDWQIDPEVVKEETTEDWADKWMKENER